ncbi:MAG TPA: hypothetical protein VGK73_25555 [Polyangiaceae bacterium]
MKTLKATGWIVLLALHVAACGGEEQVSIGDDVPQKTGEKLSDYAAHWVGYVQAYDFESGSDQVELTLDATGTGTIVLGSGTPPPPATNPDIGYPEGHPLTIATSSWNDFVPWEGYEYPVHDTQVVDRRVQFEFHLTELFEGWCALQTPYPTTVGGEFACLPNGGISAMGEGNCFLRPNGSNERVPVDCGKLALCASQGFRVCTCDAETCRAAGHAGPLGTLDGRLEADGNELTGTVTLGNESLTIHLVRE